MITFFILYENYENVNKVVTKINAECPNAMCIGITIKVNKKSIILRKQKYQLKEFLTIVLAILQEFLILKMRV